MKKPLRVLIVEDSEFDARVMVNVLRAGGYDPYFKRVEIRQTMQSVLLESTWDIILADYNMPNFSAPEALTVVQQSGLDLPFIIVSGGIGEDIAVEAMKLGAHDYLMKGNLARLAPAVERELREAGNRAARRQAELAMRESELRYRLLWETCPDAVILMDITGLIVFANPAVQEVFSYSPEELIGQNLSLLQPPHLRGGHTEGIEHYLKTGERHLNWRATETLGLRRDGVEIAIEVSYSDMLLHGQRRFVGFIRDITERKRAEKALRESEEQFQVAREIQQSLFPKTSPTISGYDMAGASFPAVAAGGDYFDYLPMLNGCLGIIVGDVTGHGVGPALLMAEARAYLRILARNREDLGEIFTRANRMLAEDVGEERYVTMILARLEPELRRLSFVNAGHPAGFVLDRQGGVKARLKRTGVPLGIHADRVYNPGTEVALAEGDTVLLLTDGLDEAMSPQEEFFGVERVLEYVCAHRAEPAAEIVKGLYQAVRGFSGNTPQMDDVTLVLIRVLA
jgi:sigma-B regulation protein RsbU (phosphoserine phosphatase)